MTAAVQRWTLPGRPSRDVLLAALTAAVYLGSIVFANYLTTHYGFIPVGFGETATAGTFAAGAALVVRDLLQDLIGRVGVAVLIVVGAALSYVVAAPLIATASALAFLTSEALDMAAYTPLRRRGKFGGYWWQAGVAAGAVIGAVADTIVFLTVAFGWNVVGVALPGQLVGRGKPVHMGRVNSERRFRYADAIGCDSADGTTLALFPDATLPDVLAWLRGVNDQGALFGGAA